MGPTGPRNFGLDLVRAIAILMVLVAHGRALLPQGDGQKWFSIGGFFGVELFFVLSGLLVGGILLRLFSPANPQQQTSTWGLIRGFWVRRWFRTLPNYLLFLLINITLCQWLFGPQEYDWRYFLLAQNLFWPSPSMMPEAWSLAVEEWFYLTLPLVFAVCILLPITRPRALLLACVGYIGVFTLLRFIWGWGPELAWGPEIRRVVAFRLDSIGYGVLIAYLIHYYPKKIDQWRNPMGLIGLVISLWALYWYIEGVILGPPGWQHRTLLFSLAGIGLAMLLPWFAALHCANRPLLRLTLFISTTSYAMYLVHLSLVLPFTQQYLANYLSGWGWQYLFYITTTMLLSALVYRYFEHPITRLREHFR